MALNLLFLTSLVLACLPLSWSYRNGARSESCYNMLVMHERNVFGTITVVSPEDCGSSCPYQLSMVGRVAGEDNLTVEESNPMTYQCGEVYYCKCRVTICLSSQCSNCVSPLNTCAHTQTTSSGLPDLHKE